MPQIDVTLRNFTILPNATRTERFAYIALLKAAITTGHRKREVLKDGARSALEAVTRVTDLVRTLSIRAGRLQASQHFLGLGSTDKGKLSYSVGNTICGLLAQRLIRVPWVLSLELYEDELNPTFLPVGQRPDYVGKSIGNQWFVLEAKGRTNRFSIQEVRDWKDQSAAITHVDGTQVTCGLASAALLEGTRALVALWDDPAPSEGGQPGQHLNLTPESFFRLYYGPVQSMLSIGGETTASAYGPLVYIPGADFYIGLHQEIQQLLAERNFNGINAFAEARIAGQTNEPEESTREMLFPDGVILRLGDGWQGLEAENPKTPIAVTVTTTSTSAEINLDKGSKAQPGGDPWPPNYLTPHSIRDELTSMVINDLLGPAGGLDEELDQREDRVTGRYLVGMLAPKATVVEAEEQDTLGTDDKDDPEVGLTDASTPPAATFFPNSIGMSFVVESEAKAILIKTQWGRYRRIKSAIQVTKKTGAPANVSKREPFAGDPLNVPLKTGLFGPLKPRPDTDPAVVVQGKIRQTPRGWVVTVFFVNTQPEQDRKKDEAWVFQPKMWVMDAAVPQRPIFIQRRDWQHDLTKMDPISREETETLEMLYRHRLEFAVGHGVSVHTTLPESEAPRALMLETEFVPRSEVEQQTPPTPVDDPNLTGVVLDMRELAHLPKPDLLATLRRLKDAYASWITRESAKSANPAERLADHLPAAQRAIDRCQRACTRIADGIRAGPASAPEGH